MNALKMHLHASAVTNIIFDGSNWASTGAMLIESLSS